MNAALRYVQGHKQELGLTGGDVNEAAVSSVVVSAHTGVTHVYLQQRHRGIDVYAAVANVNIAADGRVVGAGSRFLPHVAALAGSQSARRGAVEAVQRAARHLNLRPARALAVLERRGGPAEQAVFSGPGISESPIETRLTWLPLAGALRLVWAVDIEEPSGRHFWRTFVDAESGEPLLTEDQIIHDSIEGIASALQRPADAPDALLPSFPATDGARYNVFAFPLESPNDGPRSVVENPADPDASPFGWHDVNGTAGAEFTITRGNNAHAYTDIDANNVPDLDSSPDGGAALSFDFPLDLGQGPQTYRPFAVTNLFYWNNIMHDVTYGYGFDEASGNFQVTNYTGAMGGGDDVRAEAQDGSGTNNANFFTPAQNAAVPRPRMQMFVWTHPLPNLVTVTAPGGIAGDYAASRASFGAQLGTTGPISGTVVLVNDGGGVSPTDGCEPLVGFPAGAIALLDRGNCEFGLKVLMGQQAGARAVIVANNAPGNPATMGPGVVGNQVTIASVMVTLEAGNLFKANMPVTATLRLNPITSINRDSDLDAGVIAHEYGHGISNRLTGGPNVVNCLNNEEQMGEGWSDWFGLTMTTHPSDTGALPRGIGPYVSFQGPDGAGIRPTPYSTDMTVNPSTYLTINNPNIPVPHGVGYVWNTMLWEMYWNLVDRYGYNANLYDPWTSGGNNLALQLVMDGLKLQPCRPGFVDGRNAILLADNLLTSGANQCEIWRAFAKRGLGFGADQGSNNSRSDGVESFALPASCLAVTFGGFRPPVQDAPAVNDVNAGSTVPLKFTAEGATTIAIDSQAVSCETLVPTGEAPLALASASPKRNGQYHVNWHTDASWAGTCRRVTLRIAAPADAVAYFRFF